jgi:hypothetical protein
MLCAIRTGAPTIGRRIFPIARLLAEGKGRSAVARMIGVGPATLRRALNAKG